MAAMVTTADALRRSGLGSTRSPWRLSPSRYSLSRLSQQFVSDPRVQDDVQRRHSRRGRSPAGRHDIVRVRCCNQSCSSIDAAAAGAFRDGSHAMVMAYWSGAFRTWSEESLMLVSTSQGAPPTGISTAHAADAPSCGCSEVAITSESQVTQLPEPRVFLQVYLKALGRFRRREGVIERSRFPILGSTNADEGF